AGTLPAAVDPDSDGACARRRARDLLPAPGRGRLLPGGQDALVAQAVLEVGAGRAAPGHALEKVVHGVRERVLIADEVAGRPPALHVGVLGVGGQDGAESLLPPGIGAPEEL